MGNYNYSDELVHYGVKGMKWGVRRVRAKSSAKDEAEQTESNKKTWSTAKKVAIGAAVTAGILASAYGTYTVSKAYGREISKAKASAKSIARGLATASKIEREHLGVPEFDQSKYNRAYEEHFQKAMKKVGHMPINKLVGFEVRKQGELIRDTATSVRKKVAPNPFDIYPPKTPRELIERYNNTLEPFRIKRRR